MKTVAIIGSGDVGKVLANGFLKHGYRVIRASRTPSKLDDWLAEAEPKAMAATGTFEEAAKEGDIVVLCVQGSVAEDALDLCGLENLKGKTVIDTTNPLHDPPRVDEGVLELFTKQGESLMEILQVKAPEANFVKAFSCTGNGCMVNPDHLDSKPSMFICGNSEEAKKEVGEIHDLFGWEVADMGGVKSARAIEPLAQLWCIPVFTQGKYLHAFKVLNLS